ncbi:MAG: hydrogenase maturation nickel metallochaperone HypA [Gemmatimonadota bacterium]
MHELAVTKSILDIVLRHAEANGVSKVLTIDLSIGALSDVEAEWIQEYFDYLSRGTPAQGAMLRVSRSPLTFQCEPCSRDFTAGREELEGACCPQCGSRDIALISGTGYSVESMEAQ